MSSGFPAGGIWVGRSGGMIVARLRGAVTEADIADAQERVLRLLSWLMARE